MPASQALPPLSRISRQHSYSGGLRDVRWLEGTRSWHWILFQLSSLSQPWCRCVGEGHEWISLLWKLPVSHLLTRYSATVYSDIFLSFPDSLHGFLRCPGPRNCHLLQWGLNNQLTLFQKINHFPGMTEICRKDLLARNLNRMQKLYPTEYNIFPRTWCLPAE